MSNGQKNIVITSAVRTAIGSFGGSLKDRQAHELGAKVIKEAINRFKNPMGTINIAMCGKYNGLHDAYKSILEAFIHAGIKNRIKVNIKWINAEKIEKEIDNIDHVFKGIEHFGWLVEPLPCKIPRYFKIWNCQNRFRGEKYTKSLRSALFSEKQF